MKRSSAIFLGVCLIMAACAAGSVMQPIPATLAAAVTTAMNFPQTDHPDTQDALVVSRGADFPCLSCLAWVSGGGGRYGATASILDLHTISSASDVAFPRTLVARLESSCAACQPAAIQIQARGLTPSASVFAANFEAYSQGRASVSEFNIGAGLGGYVLDVVPVRMPDGARSKIDAVLKLEGFGGDVGAAQVGTVIDLRMNPTQAVIVIPADQGPVTVMQTADGRMKEVWAKDIYGHWGRQIIIDGVVQP